MASYLYLDIETIPTSDPTTIDRIAADIKPPAAMKKPETIKAWEENDKADAVKEAVSKTSFNGAFGQICSIAWAWDDDIPTSCRMDGAINEAQMLKNAIDMIQWQRPEGFNRPVIVGHYVADFDLRFIWQRAFVLGVRMPAWWPADPKPWSKEVCDTMAMWSGAKGSISLDNLCKALGVAGKSDVDGSMVAQMFLDGRYDDIADYNMDDVVRTRAVHRKMLIALGERE